VTLPAGSTLTDSAAPAMPGVSSDSEEWDVPLSFEQVKARLTEQLPIGRSFDGVPFENEDAGVDKLGDELIQWSWAGENPTRLIAVGARQFQPKRDGHTRVVIFEAR